MASFLQLSTLPKTNLFLTFYYLFSSPIIYYFLLIFNFFFSCFFLSTHIFSLLSPRCLHYPLLNFITSLFIFTYTDWLIIIAFYLSFYFFYFFGEKSLLFTQKLTPTVSPSSFFRLELLQCFSTSRKHCSNYCSFSKQYSP